MTQARTLWTERTMNTQTITTNDSLLARPIAAEDLNRGDFVAVLCEVTEFPSFLWHDNLGLQSPHQPVRIQWQGRYNQTPLRVKGLCLPYVFVKSAHGLYETLDVRQCQLARLSPRYAKRVWKLLRNKNKRRKPRSKKS